jgi:hypothetical protein
MEILLMDTEDFVKPPVLVHLPDGQSLDFDSYQEIANWAQEEAKIWGNLKLGDSWGKYRTNARDLQIRHFSTLQNFAQNVTDKNLDSGSMQNITSNISENLKLIAAGKRIVSTTVEGRKIAEIASIDGKVALARLFLNLPDSKLIDPHNQELGVPLHALFAAGLTKRNDGDFVTAEEAALVDLRATWDRKFEQLHESEKALERDIESYISVTQAVIDKRIRNAKNLAKNTILRFKSMRNDHINEMEAIRNTFRTELSLREPASYWSKKATSHLLGAIFSFIGLLAVAVCVIILVLKGPDLIFSSSSVNQLEFGGTILIAIPALALFWIMRSVSRIFVTNLQLLGDSRIRSTMVTTFISLMQDPQNQMTMEDRLLILQALFRPAGSDAQEDGPPSWADFLLRRMEGKQ